MSLLPLRRTLRCMAPAFSAGSYEYDCRESSLFLATSGASGAFGAVDADFDPQQHPPDADWLPSAPGSYEKLCRDSLGVEYEGE